MGFVGSRIPHFPSFSEGLSLRVRLVGAIQAQSYLFPFLFGGTFIEGDNEVTNALVGVVFPFLFGGTFIEGSF